MSLQIPKKGSTTEGNRYIVVVDILNRSKGGGNHEMDCWKAGISFTINTVVDICWARCQRYCSSSSMDVIFAALSSSSFMLPVPSNSTMKTLANSGLQVQFSWEVFSFIVNEPRGTLSLEAHCCRAYWGKRPIINTALSVSTKVRIFLQYNIPWASSIFPSFE